MAQFPQVLLAMTGEAFAHLVTVADVARAARARVDAQALAFIDGGAADELTVAGNRDAWNRMTLRPRIFAGVERPDLSVTLLGRRRAHPLVIAPVANVGFAHRDGVPGLAHAAAQTATVICLSTLAGVLPGQLEPVAPGEAARWFQLYVLRDRGATAELVRGAEAAGCEALVITGDRPVLGTRDRERHAGLRLTPALAPGGRAPQDTAELIDPSVTWADVERLAADTELPVIVKGVMTARDARLAVEHGAAGVVVSNHGGRQLDTAPAAAAVLSEIVAEVGSELDVLVDGGVRRGTDVVKALALGARGVLVGRPLLWGLAVGGTAGARRVLEILRDELSVALALVGAASIADLDPAVLGGGAR